MQIGALVAIWLIGAGTFLGFGGHVCAQSPYYQGKTIKLIQGREAGGSGDIRSKAVMPFLKKYIPGNPTIINEFMPGGGGRKAANYIFSTARPDGLTIAHISSGIVTSAVLGEIGVQYDIDKFQARLHRQRVSLCFLYPERAGAEHYGKTAGASRD